MKTTVVEIHAYGGQAPIAWATLKSYALQDPDLGRHVDIGLELADMSVDAEALAGRIVAGKPDVVGFSCYVWNIRKSLEVARRVREELPGTPIILGGPEVSPLALETVGRNPAVDVVVKGEGEGTFAELLRHYLGSGPGLGEVAGIAYREKGEVRETGARALLDVSRMPSPYLSGFPELDRFIPYVFLEGSRGCPFDCKYCDWWTSQKIRWHPVERVVKELEFLAPRSRIIFFTDSDFFMDRPRAKAVLRAFSALAKRHPIVLDFEMNPIFMDEECMALVNSGQIRPEGGVQSINDRVLEGITRPHNFEKLDRKVGRLRELAPRARICVDMIIGLPGDTLEGFHRSMDWMLSKRPDMPIAYHAIALPGSGMGKTPEKYGIDFEKEPPYRVLAAPGFPKEHILAGVQIGTYVRKFSSDPYVLEALYGVAGLLVGRKELPHFSAFRDFYEFLGGEKLGLPYEGTRELQDPAKGTAVWNQFAWFKDVHLRDENQPDDVLLALKRYVARTAAAHGFEREAQRILEGIERGLRRNVWCRRTAEARRALEAAVREWPESFAAGKRVLLWGAGAIRLQGALERPGVDLSSVELEKFSFLDTTIFYARVFPWGMEEFLEAAWEEGTFDTVVGAGVNMAVNQALAGRLAGRLARWLKPEGRMLALKAEGPVEWEIQGVEMPAGYGFSEAGRLTGTEGGWGRLSWIAYAAGGTRPGLLTRRSQAGVAD